MTRALIIVAALAACGAPPPQPPQQPPPQPQPPPSPEPPPLPGKRVTPTRVCYADGALVFEHDCGCNDALACRIDRVDGARVVVSLATDPTRPPQCDDCFAMVPARCAIAPRPRVVVVNTLAIDLADDNCWAAGR